MSQSEQDQQSKNGVGPVGTADSEVVTMTRRRQFSRAYKVRILAEAEHCQRGEVGRVRQAHYLARFPPDLRRQLTRGWTRPGHGPEIDGPRHADDDQSI
ncbi:MAG TPA: hypothetical protein VMX56_07240 [Anaerolineales bacterium]|nr:hypothetical protein [Anaerolineales bacterium]